MVWVVAVLAGLVVLLLGARWFARADTATVRKSLKWLVIVAGLGVLVFLSIRFSPAALLGAVPGIVLFLVRWGSVLRWVRGMFMNRQAHAHPSGGNTGGHNTGDMTREEAFAILGLKAGASEAQIRAAHKRLIQKLHPDQGGGDWLAARINRARHVLLNR